MVIEIDQGDIRDGKVVDFMIYRLEADRLVLLKLVVHPDYQGQGFGSELLTKLRYKLGSHRRQFLVAPVDSIWLTSDVLALLNGQDDPPLYLLGDALQEAGCCESWAPLFQKLWGSRFAKTMFAVFWDSVALKVTE